MFCFLMTFQVEKLRNALISIFHLCLSNNLPKINTIMMGVCLCVMHSVLRNMQLKQKNVKVNTGVLLKCLSVTRDPFIKMTGILINL